MSGVVRVPVESVALRPGRRCKLPPPPPPPPNPHQPPPPPRWHRPRLTSLDLLIKMFLVVFPPSAAPCLGVPHLISLEWDFARAIGSKTA